MLQYANIWWVNCRNSDIDECVIIIPDMTVAEGSNLVDKIYSGTNFENNLMDVVYDCNNNSVDVENEEDLVSSLTRLTTKLQDETLSEDDIINILEELHQLEVTVPALQETGAGKVVRRLQKKMEGRVAKFARQVAIRWKKVVDQYEPPVEDGEDQEGYEDNDESMAADDSAPPSKKRAPMDPEMKKLYFGNDREDVKPSSKPKIVFKEPQDKGSQPGSHPSNI